MDACLPKLLAGVTPADGKRFVIERRMQCPAYYVCEPRQKQDTAGRVRATCVPDPSVTNEEIMAWRNDAGYMKGLGAFYLDPELPVVRSNDLGEPSIGPSTAHDVPTFRISFNFDSKWFDLP